MVQDYKWYHTTKFSYHILEVDACIVEVPRTVQSRAPVERVGVQWRPYDVNGDSYFTHAVIQCEGEPIIAVVHRPLANLVVLVAVQQYNTTYGLYTLE